VEIEDATARRTRGGRPEGNCTGTMAESGLNRVIGEAWAAGGHFGDSKREEGMLWCGCGAPCMLRLSDLSTRTRQQR
jgi:hypothetical protein